MTLMRYISKRFLLGILAVMAMCLVLVFFADFVELLRQAGKYERVPMATLIFLALLRLPAYSELILPIAVLIGSIGAFLMLSRSSELTIFRAGGMSAWQFILPGLVVAFVLGIFATTVYNPLAANARAFADKMSLEAFKKRGGPSLLKTKNAGAWLRQNGADGQSIIHADATANQGLELGNVSIIHYDRSIKFFERIEAEKATLKDGRWELDRAWVTLSGEQEREPAFYERYFVSTHLTTTQVKDSLGSVRAISFWELPNFIEIAEKAKLPATRHKLQYQALLSQPFVLAVMVLLAATCSLKAFRFGNIQTMVITGLAAGFAFFVAAELSRNLGRSGLASPEAAAWTPPLIAALLALTVLLRQEDG